MLCWRYNPAGSVLYCVKELYTTSGKQKPIWIKKSKQKLSSAVLNRASFSQTFPMGLVFPPY